MAESGLPGLTVRAVAERAGCSTGLVFHTFPSKEALLAHARQMMFERAAARVDAVEELGGAPSEVLRNVALALLALGRDGEEEARVWVSFLAAAVADPVLARHHLTGNRALLDRMTRLIAAVAPGRGKPPPGRRPSPSSGSSRASRSSAVDPVRLPAARSPHSLQYRGARDASVGGRRRRSPACAGALRAGDGRPERVDRRLDVADALETEQRGVRLAGYASLATPARLRCC